MFAYNPTVNDNSGAILAQGQIGAAQTQAEMYNRLGNDIGGALASIGSMYGQANQTAQAGDSAYEALGAIGQMYPGMKSAFTALGKMDPRTRRLASMSILDNLGAISQLGIAGMRSATAEQGQQLQREMPIRRAQVNAAAQTAAGQQRMTTLPPNINRNVIP